MVARVLTPKRRTSSVYELATAAALYASALVMAAAISTTSYRWLGWVALLPLFHAIRRSSPGCAAIAGALWGTALFTFGGFVFHTGIDRSWSSFVLLASIPALYSGLGAVVTRRAGFSPYLLALGWIGVELALQPVGLKLGLLAATQGDGFAIRALGSFTGYALVAFLVAYVNAAILSVLCETCKSVARPRPLSSGSRSARRILPQDAFVPWHAFLRLAQPRGPPAPVLVPVA